ncbi:hypothetical protein LTR37_005100 [Vermiconidia calcicola]|uniref:Uncharacterized protein n=1 Tax=Vermiconidia calcicola TaxID=1690605 RepID=A0ACC3NL54_9PEZI|nr:hypothetical protein LTR37_005100 [Vermiconidia calcicola]
MSHEDRHMALTHLDRLRRSVTHLTTIALQDAAGGAAHSNEATSSAHISLKGLEDFLSNVLETSVYNERRTPDSTMALRTFEVPELLELILGYLRIPDILRVYQVSRGMRDAIDNSSRLQTRLCLRSAPSESHLDLPFKKSLYGPAGFVCSEDYGRKAIQISESGHTTYKIKAKFGLNSDQELPKIGLRHRSMFICQPPVYEMTVHVQCCGQPWLKAEEVRTCKVSAARGLTIGDLYDSAKGVLASHRLCPKQVWHRLKNDGSVDVMLTFNGRVPLTVGDPILSEWKANEAQKVVEKTKREERTAHLKAYCVAKKEAHEGGKTIPTFQEFLVAEAETETGQKMTAGFPERERLAMVENS